MKDITLTIMMDQQNIMDYNSLKPKYDLLARENEYLKAKLNIHTNSHNIGEKDEVLLLIELFHFNQMEQFDKLVAIFGEESSKGIKILDLNTNQEILDINKFLKASGKFKADCKIILKKTEREIRSSIKSKNGSKPSIMNHQRRDARMFQPGGNLNYLLPDIDLLVSEYHKFRREGKPEEIKFSDMNDLTQKSRITLQELIWYFMFKGPNKKSDANSVIVKKGDDITFIPLVTKEEQMKYIEIEWDNFDLSLVSRKGNPKKGGKVLKYKEDYEDWCSKDSKFKEQYELMKPWVYETTDNGKNNPENKVKIKAALHVRWQ
jgi:hypothetical protein